MMNSEPVAENQFSRAKRPPLVKGLPVVGSVLPMVRNPLQFLRNSYQDYGEVFRINAAGREIVVLAGLEANRYIGAEGRDHFSSEQSWGESLDAMGCPHLFIGAEGDVHQYQRKLLKPEFSKAKFKNRLEDLALPVNQVLEQSKRKRVSVGPLLRQIVSNQIGNILQGVAPSSSQVEHFIRTSNTILNVHMLRKWPRVMKLNPKFLYSAYVTHQFAMQLLNSSNTLSNNAQGWDTYLDKIFSGKQENPHWFTQGDMRAHALVPFILGLDTVASTAGFMLYELVKKPWLQQRLKAEVEQVFADGFPDFASFDAMNDVKGMVYETLRLYPTAFGMNRTAAQDFEFRGARVKKGENVLVFTAANHFSHRYFPEPEKFDIDRYRAPRNEHKQPGVFAPFGRGNHACVGAGLAELQLMVILSVLLYQYEIKPVNKIKDLKMVFDPAPQMSANFKVNLV